jgi:hypothetical protein
MKADVFRTFKYCRPMGRPHPPSPSPHGEGVVQWCKNNLLIFHIICGIMPDNDLLMKCLITGDEKNSVARPLLSMWRGDREVRLIQPPGLEGAILQLKLPLQTITNRDPAALLCSFFDRFLYFFNKLDRDRPVHKSV